MWITCDFGVYDQMKTALNMLIYYVVAVLAGLLVAAGIYMICCDLTMLVSGEEMKFFNWNFFVHGLLVTFPMVVSFVLGFLIFYGIRHSENHFFRLGTYILLCALTWLILIPLSFNLKKSYEESFGQNPEVNRLSSGYFRKIDGNIFYFSRVSEDGKAEGIFIDLTGISGETGKIVRFSEFKTDSIIKNNLTEAFADVSIKDAVELPAVVFVPLLVYEKLIEKAQNAWEGGFAHWLCFLSFVLAVCSVVAFQYTSGWRLINALAVLIAGGAVCLIDFAFYCGFIFANVRKVWEGYFSSLAQNTGGFLKNLFLAEDPLLTFINLVCFCLIFVTGIFLFIFKHKKQGESAE